MIAMNTAARMTDRQQAEHQLFTLYRSGLLTGEFIELRCLDCRKQPAGLGPRRYFRSIMALIDAAMRYRDEWDVFFGVGLRRCPSTTDITKCGHLERGLDHISRLPAVWADLDVQSDDEPDKPHASIQDVLHVLRGYKPYPTLIVGSGAGIHAYWTLESPSSNLERAVAINKSIRDRFQGDNVVDAARILRLAGTYNHKHSRPLPVRLHYTTGVSE